MSDRKPTFDERLDRLTERHEALRQSVGLLAVSQTKTGKTIVKWSKA